MKKVFLAFVAAAGFTSANAQSQNSVTLNVKLNPIQTLMVNNGQKNVDLIYTSKDDYANGVASMNVDHLTVFSTGGFQVKVKSADSEMQNNGKKIQANSILLTASAGSESVNGAQYVQNLQLSQNETMLVSSNTGGVDKKISINYKGAGANAYLDNYVANQNPTVYTTQLTYTIISQ